MRKTIVISSAIALCAVAQATPQYTPLAYVEAPSGNAYINTGIYPSSTTRVWTDFQMRSADKNARLFGVERNTVSYSFAIQNANSIYWIYTAQDGNESNTSSGKAADTNRHTLDFNNNRAISIDGGNTYSATISSTFSKKASAPLYIGAARYGGNPSNYSKHRIYAFKVWEGGQLVRDLFPAAVGSLTGLMDRVSWNFYTSKGTSAYTGSVGADIVTFSSDRREAYEYSLGVSYDSVENLADGETYSWTAPSAAQTVATDTTATCTGHRLYSVDPETGALTLAHDGAGETTASFTHAAGAVWHVEWLWDFGFAAYYVSKSGSDSNDGKSWETAFATPKKALAVAPDYATIHIGEGTWYNAGNCDMVVSNAVTVAGAGPGKTILDGNAAAVVGANYIRNDERTSSSTWRWVMEVRHKKAVIHGFTMQGGFRYNPSGQPSASGLQLYSGTASNCVVRFCRGGNQDSQNGGGGVYVGSGALLKDCEIYGNVVRYNNNTTGWSGGVLIYGGTVDSCVISNNSAGASAQGVSLRGGKLRNSLIADNHGHIGNDGKLNTTGGYGGGVYLSDGSGLVENCVIKDNTRGLKYAAGAYVNHSGAILRNCLVVGNTSQNDCGGVRLAAGRVENCTISGCSSAINPTTGSGLRQTGGTALNNIVYGNEANSAADTVVTSGTFKTNVVTMALSLFTAGDGNVAANPLFTDAANGDYTLRFGSPAIDAANPNAAITNDIAGVLRPQGPANDIGCHERIADGSFAVAFPPNVHSFVDEGTASFTAMVAGASGDVTYAWYVDGVLQDGETGATATFDFGYGRHSVKVVATSGGQSSEFEVTDVVSVNADTAYVSQSGSDTYPYETLAKATPSLKKAIAAVYATDARRGTVWVAPSDATGYITDDYVIKVDRNIRIVSTDGPEATRIKCTHPAYSDGRRAFELNHPGALVSGFTIYNGHWYDYVLGDSGGGAIQLYNGVVSNCVIRSTRGCRNGGAARIRGGLMTHCVITNCYSQYNNDSTGCGGAIYMDNGEIAHCIIRNCRAGGEGNKVGGGVYMVNGRLRDTEISGCYPIASSSSKMGAGLYMTGGTAERCVITNNYPGTLTLGLGGGVYMTGGTLRNCLVAENRASSSGAGVYQTGGTVEFCTVTDNTSSSGSASGLLLNGSKAVCRYNVLDGNGAGVSAEPNCNIAFTAAASFATNIVVTPSGTTYGTDNIYEAAGFNSAKSRDWTLGSGSKAIDAVASADWVADDLNGNARPEDGDGMDGAAWDIGCYEAPDAGAGPLRCSFSPDSVTGLGSATAVFTASASGTGADGQLTYTWDFGDGATATAVGGDPSVQSVSYSGYGSRTVSLTVEAAGGQSHTYTIADCVKVGASSIFVDATSTNAVWPYATWDTAATSLSTVLSTLITDGATPIAITVTNGTYTIDDIYYNLSYPLTLQSLNGPASTALVAASPDGNNKRIFNVSHDSALVSGFTMRGAYNEGGYSGDLGAACLRITAGVVSNCIVQSCTGSRTGSYGPGAISVAGTGRLVDSIVRGCASTWGSSSGQTTSGGGIAIYAGGIVSRCMVSNCYATAIADETCPARGGGVFVNGGTLEDSIVVDCSSRHSNTPSKRFYGGCVFVGPAGGTVSRCIIGDAALHKTYGAAAALLGGRMENTLIRGAVAGSDAQALHVAGGSVVNCTVVTNGYGTAATSPVAAVVAGGSVSNCLFAVNNGGDIAQTGGIVAYSRYAEAEGGTNLSRAPVFRNAAAGDWRLSPTSPGIDAGDWTALGESREAVRAMSDLSGASRLFGGQVDMGCHESRVAGTVILLR